MGRSDSYLVDFYGRNLKHSVTAKSVAFLGFSQENFITSKVSAVDRSFYDVQLGNWDINVRPWNPGRTYDLIVCTRCAYFCDDPVFFINDCLHALNPGGSLVVDWGLGDHWRFKNYKVGWMKDGEHEYSEYGGSKQYLYSCCWSSMFEQGNPVVDDFVKNIRQFGYNESLTSIIEREVPVCADIYAIQNKDIYSIDADFLSLWPEAPQLYICYRIQKG